MSTLATTFGVILNGLKAVIAELAAKDRPRTQFLVQIWTRLNKTIQRFEKLVTNWRNNSIPKQRHRPGRKSRPRTTGELGSVKGLGGSTVRRDGEAIVQAIATAVVDSPPEQRSPGI